MKVRDSFCAHEAFRIIEEDMYQIVPMIGHCVPVKYIVDVGGNVGGFTIAASNAYPDSEIIVFEPDPEVMDDLKYNTRDCSAKIHYVTKACVGSPVDTVTFIRNTRHCGGSRVKDTWHPAPRPDDEEELQVPATTLPAVLDEYKFPSVDILKIDAEGAEAGILTSLKRAGWMSKVHWLRGEWHGRENWARIEDALRDTHIWRLAPAIDNGEMIAHNRDDA